MNKDTCSTCIYWDEFEESIQKDDKDYGWCNHPFIGEGARWANEGETSCLDYPYNEGGNFIMGKDFGCVHHQERADGTGTRGIGT